MAIVKTANRYVNGFSRSAATAAYASFVFLLVGCAAATITPQETAPAPGAIQRPDKIVVYDFAVSAADVTENQGILQKAYRAVADKDEAQREAEKLATGRAAAQELSKDLVKQLQELGFNVDNPPRGTPAGANALVIDGQFLSADEGNRARRLIIGFGAGASKLVTQVTVSQVPESGAANQLLSFKTAADSGKMPGAAVTMGAGAAAQGAAAATAVTAATGAAKVYSSMLSTLVDKTAKQITAYLSQYFASQGWISSDQAQKAKLAE